MDASTTALAGFQPIRVLNSDPFTGIVALLGRFEDKPGDAIVLLTHTQLDAGGLDGSFFAALATEQQFHNDIYYKYTATPPVAFSKLNADLIYPATSRHINKHSSQKVFVVHETPDLYARVTRPLIASIPADRLKWVHNILDGSAEAERRLHHDPDPGLGFVLLPDMKWDQQQLDQLYCVAICNRRDVPCLRDLGSSHLPLLRHLHDAGCRVLAQRFGVARDQLRVYLHYQPSYYHLHVHYASVKVVSGSVAAGKAHLLADVIDNIELWPDYYQKRTLTMTLGENEDLLKLLHAAGAAARGTSAEAA